MRLRNIFSRKPKQEKKAELFNNTSNNFNPYKLICNRNRPNDKILIYDQKSKKLMKKTTGIGKKGSKNYIPGAMDIIYRNFLKKDLNYKDPKNRFKIESLKKNKIAGNTLNSFKITINSKFKKNEFYLKVTSGLDVHKNSIQEMILQKYFEKKGINIIKPKLAYLGDSKNKNQTIHFLVYDYTNLNNVFESYMNNKISKKDYKIIENKLNSFSNENNFNDKKIFDFLTKNTYYKKTKNGYKLFISDTYVNHFDFDKLIRYAKQENLIEN